jgi:hypothetical protein
MNMPSILPLICGAGTHPLPTSKAGLHLRSWKHPKARDGWYKWERESTTASIETDFDDGNTQLPSTGAYDKMIDDSYYARLRFF